jgi:coproporphyrinogen III oxidase-like Fe-S oxidoreductase
VILQLKLGALEPEYFRAKFDVDIVERFAPALKGLRDEGMLSFDADSVTLTDEGLLRVDQLLPDFYETQYRNARYT